MQLCQAHQSGSFMSKFLKTLSILQKIEDPPSSRLPAKCKPINLFSCFSTTGEPESPESENCFPGSALTQTQSYL